MLLWSVASSLIHTIQRDTVSEWVVSLQSRIGVIVGRTLTDHLMQKILRQSRDAARNQYANIARVVD